MKVGLLASAVLWALIAWCLSGCGTKIDAWGLKVELPQGFDVGAGVNALDKVDNRRGVSEFKK